MLGLGLVLASGIGFGYSSLQSADQLTDTLDRHLQADCQGLRLAPEPYTR